MISITSKPERRFELSRTQKEIMSGCVGAFCATFTGQPFDIVKVRMQTSAVPLGVFQVAKDIVKSEGPLAFYKGTTSPLVGAAFIVSLQFYSNNTVKRFF